MVTVVRCCLLVCVFALTACAGQNKRGNQEILKQNANLLSGDAFYAAGQLQPELPEVDLLAVNDDMRAYLKKHVPHAKLISEERRAELILEAMLDEGLEIQYDNLRTLTAEQVFAQRAGNCLSFTNLFIALARELDVKVAYQEVRIPPTWSVSGETHFFNLHINALVDLPHKQQVVDFDLRSDARGKTRPVSDFAAASQYYNNMAVHYITLGDWPAAFLHSRRAINMRPRTGYYWANLGTILRHSEDQAGAEQAYLLAIEISGEPSAVSNLARLYKSQGRVEEAAEYAARASYHRSQNPYYLQIMAKQAYAAGDYQESIRLMRKAIRLLPQEDEFHRTLGLSYLQLGETEKAEKSFLLAAENAKRAEDRQLYARKLELLKKIYAE